MTERGGADAYTDTAPSVAPVGKNYPGSDVPCLTNQILPLSSNKTTLHNRINALTDGGSTAGHIGIAWGWYMISPNFGYLWPADSQPAPYDTLNLLKAAVIMTDGEFNTVHCNGAIAQNHPALALVDSEPRAEQDAERDERGKAADSHGDVTHANPPLPAGKLYEDEEAARNIRRKHKEFPPERASRVT